MPKTKSWRSNSRVRNLITISSLTAIVLAASTYAWFVGMRTVNVSSFDVEIAATDSLLLSLNGQDFSETVAISQALLTEGDPSVTYAGHSNSWGGTGLIPMSSIGEMDSAASRMKLFEKASLTATPGGYRLMSSRVPNGTGNTEQPGYVAFDLFIKNASGTQYITGLNPADEEAIYLTVDSAVKVASGGVQNTGIENSVRVAFNQIGRVIASSDDVAEITGITCSNNGNVTGICRNAQIWEPNDTSHVQNAINWYNTSCRKRTGLDVRSSDSYGAEGTCKPVIDGIAYPTYAVKKDIASSNNVDIYDGLAYNTYVPTGESLLEEFRTFTDTKKLERGTSRSEFMTLAPNSITKVRIYIYIEGQDIDNYDFASIGKKISVNFGFTKQRFTEDDVDYSGSDVNQGIGPSESVDKTAPVIKLTGNSVITMAKTEEPDEFVEPGFTATDNKDADIQDKVVVSGTVNTSVPGTYYKIYSVRDMAGNTGVVTRKVIITEE